jgi:two-component system, cell cycle response regulator
MDNYLIKRPSDCAVLVVDDEEVFCELLSATLQDSYKVSMCQSGRRAMELIEESGFDLVIADLKLNDMSGIEVLKFAKEKDDLTELMVITGYASLESASRAIMLGVSAYLTKPLSLADLLLQVEKAIATRLFHLKSVSLMQQSDSFAPHLKEHLGDMTSLYHFSRKLMLSLELPEIIRVILQEINEKMNSTFCVLAMNYLNYAEIAAMPRVGEIDITKVRDVLWANWDNTFNVFDKAMFEQGQIPLRVYKGRRGACDMPAQVKPLGVQLSIMGQNIGSLLIFRDAKVASTPEESQFLYVFTSFVSSVIEHGYIDLQAKLQARTDGLTGIANHRSFHETLAREIARADRNKSEFGLIIIDIDDFKLINDRHGHLVGDAVIKDLCCRLSSMVRKGDTFARQGGEEFSLILPETSLEGAKIMADRVCKKINSAPFVFSRTSVPYTISLGLSIYSGGSPRSKDAVLSDADKALYLSKKNGKNLVSII